jgi:hypothetical protein
VHRFELCWMTAFSVVLLVTLRPYIARDWVRAVTVLAAVGGYYVVARPPDQTQIEALVGFPLYVTLWALLRAVDDPERRGRWLVASGVAAGVVGTFKLVVLAVPLWFCVVAAVQLKRREQATGRDLLRAAGAFVVGVLLVLGPFVVYYAALGVTGLVFRTTFVYPPQITKLGGLHTTALLKDLVKQAVKNYGALVVLAGAGLLAAVRQRKVDERTALLAGWVVVGTLVVLTQRWSAYQSELLLVPLALLAGHALDGADVHARRPAVLAVGIVVGLGLLVPLSTQARKAEQLARHGFALSDADRVAYQRSQSDELVRISGEVAALGGLPGTPGPIYVLGNPVYYQLLDRSQALAQNGWSPEQWLPDQWRDFAIQLTAARPTYLFVDHVGDRLLADEPAARAAIDGLYAEYWTSPSSFDDAGTWYRLR